VPLSNRTCFQVNLRDGLVCQRCGRTPRSSDGYHNGFEYHHRTHRADGGHDGPENIVLVCHACHRDHHEGRVDLSASLPRRATPGRLDCRRCGATLDARNVKMNCGWYHCGTCDRRTHLFDHFGLVERTDDGPRVARAVPAPADGR